VTRNESYYAFVAFFVRLFTLLRCWKKKRPYKKNISIVLHFFFLLFFAGMISLNMPESSFATGKRTRHERASIGILDLQGRFPLFEKRHGFLESVSIGIWGYTHSSEPKWE